MPVEAPEWKHRQKMLFVIDVGNTNTSLGVFEGRELRAQWRLSTNRNYTADEFGILTRNLFTLRGHAARSDQGHDGFQRGAHAEPHD